MLSVHLIELHLIQDAISTEDMTTLHGEDGNNEFAGGEWGMGRSKSMKRSAIVQIGNAQQVLNSDTLKMDIS